VLSEKEDCTPVVWKNCTLLNETVPLEVPKTICTTDGSKNYTTYEPAPKTITLDKTDCTVRTAIDCKPEQKQVVVQAKWQECQDMKVESCKDFNVCVPFQEKIHKFKCLSKQDPNNPIEGYDG